jgi:hypothetical protein
LQLEKFVRKGKECVDWVYEILLGGDSHALYVRIIIKLVGLNMNMDKLRIIEIIGQ